VPKLLGTGGEEPRDGLSVIVFFNATNVLVYIQRQIFRREMCREIRPRV
jgi:hypothetical protein